MHMLPTHSTLLPRQLLILRPHHILEFKSSLQFRLLIQLAHQLFLLLCQLLLKINLNFLNVFFDPLINTILDSSLNSRLQILGYMHELILKHIVEIDLLVFSFCLDLFNFFWLFRLLYLNLCQITAVLLC